MLLNRRLLPVLVVILFAALLPAAGVFAAPAAQSCTYRATFLGDVTIPDNMVIPANQTFVKTWRLRNDGSCAWGPGQPVDSLALTGGNPLGSASIVPLASYIGPGQTASVSVTMTAPGAAGLYRSEWKLRRTNGQTFGLGATGARPFYVQIRVSGGSSEPGPAARIQFAAGATTASVSGSVRQGETDSYLIRALAGQEMTMAIVSANEQANFAITGVADMQPYKRVVLEDRYFSFVLPSTQDYRIDVMKYDRPVTYILSVAISPR